MRSRMAYCALPTGLVKINSAHTPILASGQSLMNTSKPLAGPTSSGYASTPRNRIELGSDNAAEFVGRDGILRPGRHLHTAGQADCGVPSGPGRRLPTCPT